MGVIISTLWVYYMKFRFLALLSVCMALLVCKETFARQSMEFFNNRMIYQSGSSCSDNINVYIKPIKKENHQTKNDYDTSMCSAEYTIDGKTLKLVRKNKEEIKYQYAPDGTNVELIDEKNNHLANLKLIKMDKQITQISIDNYSIDYNYNEKQQLTSIVYYKKEAEWPVMTTIGYQWLGDKIISSCLMRGVSASYSEYDSKNITTYTTTDDFGNIDLSSCEQLKKAYDSNDASKFAPITMRFIQCEKTNEQNDCTYAKTFVDGKLIYERNSYYEYY